MPRDLRTRRLDPLTRGLALAAAMVAAPPGSVPQPCATVRIPEIQGRSHYSPLTGRRVCASGVVTTVTGGLATVQDPAGDGDPATSDGIALDLAGATPPRVGDRIAFTGTVTEAIPGRPESANLSTTTVIADTVRVLGSGRALPRPVVLGTLRRPPAEIISRDELPVNLSDEAQARANRFDPEADAIDFYESLEGMRVTVSAPVAVSALQTYNARSSEVVVLADGGRGIARGRRTAAGGILLQSGPHNLGPQNTERIRILLDSALHAGPIPSIAVGDRLDDVTGVMRYDFGSYQMAATGPLRVRAAARHPEPTPLAREPDRLTVATYNVYNLSPQPEDSAQRRLLAGQIVGPLGAPDILALQEIQDESGEADDGTTDATGTLRSLALAIRDAGGPEYRFFDVAPADGRQGGAPGGNIRNAFLYAPDRVTLISYESLTPARLAEAGIPDTAAFRDSRDPLVGVFRRGGRRITLVNNHLSSRFGSTPAFGAVQPFVQAGEEARAAQVVALRAYAGWLLTADPSAAVVVLGDMNTFEFSDDLAVLLPGQPRVLHPLADLVPPDRRYSYNFEGNSQTLDHVFVSEAAAAGAELVILHLNADFPSRPGATASDHDPVLARFRGFRDAGP